VCVLVPEAAPALRATAEGQTRTPDHVLSDPLILQSGLTRALAVGDVEWLWLLDGGAEPRADALAALIRAAAPAPELPPVTLLASKVVRNDGALAAGVAPWFRRDGTEVTLAAMARGLLPVRAAPASSLLVRREAAATHGLPADTLAAPAAALEWTSRLLRHGTGLLVPASVAVIRHAEEWLDQRLADDPADDVTASTRVLLGPAWSTKERLRLAVELVARARAHAAAGGASRPALAAAVARGLAAGRPHATS
jgi:hypothetical protein